jgi:hypothetical protein
MYKTKTATLCAGTATTTKGAVVLGSINVNKTLIGTVTIQDGATVLGTLAIGTPANQYWFDEDGTTFANLQVVLSAADDVTLLTCKI